MRKFKLKEGVANCHTGSRICQDHKEVLKESDFPKGNADILVKKGFLVEIDKPKENKKK